MLTLEKMGKGDLALGGTLSRLTERGPKVMSKFYESPVFGFGFAGLGSAGFDTETPARGIIRRKRRRVERGDENAPLLSYILRRDFHVL